MEHIEILVTALVSLSGGLIAGASFILKMKTNVEAIQLTTNRIEADVIELKEFKEEFIEAKTRLNGLESDVNEVKQFVKDGKTELAAEFTKTVNNIIEMMRDYMKRNDDEVRRLRDGHDKIQNEILLSLTAILREVKK